MRTKYNLVIHPILKVLGYFKENGEFVQVVDKKEGGEEKMKLKIFGERPKVASEKEVYLKLESRRGEVIVCACDEKGNRVVCGNLVSFHPNGTMYKMGGVNTDLDFQLDSGGRIREEEDC